MALIPVSLGLSFAFWKVWLGRWQHVDASVPSERAELNRFMLPVLLVSALVCLFWLDLRALGVGLAASSLILAAALLLARWLKLSLHVGFAGLAVCVLAEGATGLLLSVLALILMVWSRLALQRHTWRDIWAGLLAGLAAGLIWRTLQ